MTALDPIARERSMQRKRDLNMVAAWEAGQSHADIALAFQLSRENVKDRIERHFMAGIYIRLEAATDTTELTGYVRVGGELTVLCSWKTCPPFSISKPTDREFLTPSATWLGSS